MEKSKILDINDLLTYHEYWRKNLSADDANNYITLSKTLMHKVIENDGNILGISLSFPDDCLDLSIFYSFLDDILNASYSTEKNEGTICITFT